MRCLPPLLLLFLMRPAVAADNWPQFRGPEGDGVVDTADLPLQWTESHNVVWKTAIHDHGWSSPVIWGKQIWLTTATKDGKQLFAVCVNRESGKVVHDLKLFDVAEPQKIASVNSYASPTPVIEAERVYVHYGSDGTACLDTTRGQVVWTRRDLNCDHHMGAGASPILFEDLLIFTVDGCDLQFVVALNKRTGETVWKSPRSIDLSGVHYMTRKCYGTPTVYRAGDRLELITPASRGMIAYDPYSGRELWKLPHRGWSISPRPICRDGLLYFVIDYDRPELWAVRPGSDGLKDDESIVWRLMRGAPSTPSFMVCNDLVFAVDDKGIATCLESNSGELVWRERLDGNYSASPLCDGNRIYFFNHDADATVIRADRHFVKLAENDLDGEMRASPAVSGKALFIRTRTHLYRIESAD